jgi:hypothetical protein
MLGDISMRQQVFDTAQRLGGRRLRVGEGQRFVYDKGARRESFERLFTRKRKILKLCGGRSWHFASDQSPFRNATRRCRLGLSTQCSMSRDEVI